MYTEIIVAFITGGALTAIIKGLFDLIRMRLERKDAFAQAINELNEIYSEIDILKSRANCDRVLIFSTQNGGGIPVPGNEIYASILFETYDKGLDAIKSSWQKRLIDEGYVRLLLELEEHGIVSIETEKMADGILKDISIIDGIKSSVIAKVKSTETRYYYIMCCFRGTDSDEIAVKVHTMDAVAKIRDII